MFHLTPFKKIELGLQTLLLPQTPYVSYGIGQNLKILILFLPRSICIHSNLKGIIILFKQKSDVIFSPHGRVLSSKWLILVKMVSFCHIWPLWGTLNILITAKIKFRFSIFGLSHRLYRGSEVPVGSEDPLQKI